MVAGSLRPLTVVLANHKGHNLVVGAVDAHLPHIERHEVAGRGLCVTFGNIRWRTTQELRSAMTARRAFLGEVQEVSTGDDGHP